MLKKLLPKQNNFFELFQQAAYLLVCAAEEFKTLTEDLPNVEQHVNKIVEYETSADDCALITFELLHKTFITPFDRYDLHQITRRLDDVVDLINRNAQRIMLYQVKALPAEIQQMAAFTVNAAHALKTIMGQLANLKNAPTIIQRCHAISEIDRQAEQAMLRGIGKLFAEENDFKNLLKMKEIYQYSIEAIQQCHDLADAIKDIVLEYS